MMIESGKDAIGQWSITMVTVVSTILGTLEMVNHLDHYCIDGIDL